MFRDYLKRTYNLTDEQMNDIEYMLEVDKTHIENAIVKLDLQASANFITDFMIYANECLTDTVYNK